VVKLNRTDRIPCLPGRFSLTFLKSLSSMSDLKSLFIFVLVAEGQTNVDVSIHHESVLSS